MISKLLVVVNIYYYILHYSFITNKILYNHVIVVDEIAMFC